MEEQIQNKKRFNLNLKPVAKKILFIILGLWLIFATGYIAYDQWIRFLNQQILTAYQAGVADTIRTLMSQAELCQPVSLVDGERTINVLKVGCPPAEQQPIEQP
jgi:hypothetical protein